MSNSEATHTMPDQAWTTPSTPVRDASNTAHPYGCFSADGMEFIVNDPRPPRSFDNFLWNDALFSNIQQTGVGYCDYQVDGKEAVQMLTGVGRICDFDVFGRDHLMSRLIYIKDVDSGEFWCVNGEPVWREMQAFECHHGLGYTVIRSITDGIEARFRVFVPPGRDPVELWTLELTNRSNRPRCLSIFTYVQFQFKFKWGFDSYGDMIFRSSIFDPKLNAVIATKHPHRKPHDHLTGFLTANREILAFDGSRDAFVGAYQTLCEPIAVVRGSCSNTAGSSDATIAATQFAVDLKPAESVAIDLILGATDSADGVAELRDKYLGSFDSYFEQLRKCKTAMVSHNQVTTPDAHFDRLLNGWIRQASLFGATWCRWGWNGYRDIVQHALGVASFAPERTRAIMLEALRHQFANGLALRGWNPVDEKPYSDSALWLVFTLITYLKETGDFSLLDETVPYYDHGTGTVREHIDQALDFLEGNKGTHGLLLIKFGDWNDSLTAVGLNGRGESVWLSQAYAEAMRQMAELAGHLGEELNRDDYLGRYQRIKTAINEQAWDGAWYARCFDDEGEPVGSSSNGQARIFIESQAWALIADIADDERAERLIESCDAQLLTDLGYTLLSPTFTRPDERIGRISCLEPGICENGTIYSHTNAWMVLGLLRSGRVDKAYEILCRVLPGYLSGDSDDPKRNCLPYVPANCYFGPDHRNNPFQMEFTWITGSVAWLNHLMLQEMLGMRADFRGLRIDPRAPAHWEEYRVERSFRGAIYQITVSNPERLSRGRVDLVLDGVPLEGDLLPLPEACGTHEVLVILKRDPCEEAGSARL